MIHLFDTLLFLPSSIHNLTIYFPKLPPPVANLSSLSFPGTDAAAQAYASYKQASSYGPAFTLFGEVKKQALVLTPLVSTLVSSHSVGTGIEVLEAVASSCNILTTPSCLYATPSPEPSATASTSADAAAAADANPPAPPPVAPSFDPATADPEALVEMSASISMEKCMENALTQGILSIKDATSILASLPQTPATPHYLGLRLVDALVSVTKFENENAAHFFRKRARWSVLEFCEETISSESKLHKIPHTTLVRIGRCIYGANVEPARDAGEMIIRGGLKGQDVAREFSPGDNLIVQDLPPTSPAPEGFVPTVCECRVEMAQPLILAVIRKNDDKRLLALGQGSGCKFRVDRVASRIVYSRQLAAFSSLASFANDKYGDARTASLTPTPGSNTPTNSNPYGPASGANTPTMGDGKISPVPMPMSNSQREKLQKVKAAGANDIIVKVLTSSNPEEVVSSAASPYSVGGATQPSKGPSAEALANNPQLAAIMENLRRANPSLYNNMQGQGGGGGGYGGGRGGLPDRASNLNPSQRAAMDAAMNRRLTLVQGPPGTGKTSSSTAIVQAWIDKVKATNRGGMGNDKIFCGSDSNIAVDNLLEGLLKKGVRAVRVGRPESASPHLLEYCVEEMASRAKKEAIMRNPNDKNGIANAGHQTKQRMIKGAEVICATCIGAAAGYLSNFSFCHILVDEASQCHELR